MNKIKYALIIGTCSISILTGCSSQDELAAIEIEADIINEDIVAVEMVEENSDSKSYEVAGITDSEKFNKLFISIQEALESEDKELIADSVLYPLRVNEKDGFTEVENREEFLKDYEIIFSQEVKNALKSQIVEDLFVNYQGVMVGGGEIWLGSLVDESKYGIVAINH